MLLFFVSFAIVFFFAAVILLNHFATNYLRDVPTAQSTQRIVALIAGGSTGTLGTHYLVYSTTLSVQLKIA